MTDGPVRLLNMFHAHEGQEAEVERATVEMMRSPESQALSLAAELMRDSRDPTMFVLQVDFESEEQLGQYLAADWRNETLAAMPKLIRMDFKRYVLEPVAVRARV